MFIKKYLINIILISCTFVLLVGCEEEISREKVHLENAKNSAQEKSWKNVILEVQKFIAIENIASSEDKQEAWMLLANATIYLGLIEEAIKILKIMLHDKDYHGDDKGVIYEKLIRLYDRNKNFEKAANARIEFIDYNEMEGDAAAQLLLEAGLNHQSAAQYKESDIILNFALEIVKSSALRAEIFYYKAYVKTISDELNFAKIYLIKALESNKIAEDIEGRIYYLLGEIDELEKKYLTAYNYYKKALNLYPNRMLIQNKIDFIEENYSEFLKK